MEIGSEKLISEKMELKRSTQELVDDWVIGYVIFLTIWLIRIIVTVRAGYIGDDGTRFMLLLTSPIFWIVSFLVGLVGLNKHQKIEQRIKAENFQISLELFKILSNIVCLSPLIAMAILGIAGHWFPSKPFSGA